MSIRIISIIFYEAVNNLGLLLNSVSSGPSCLRCSRRPFLFLPCLPPRPQEERRRHGLSSMVGMWSQKRLLMAAISNPLWWYKKSFQKQGQKTNGKMRNWLYKLGISKTRCILQYNILFWHADDLVIEMFLIHWAWFKDSDGSNETVSNSY